MIKIKPSLLLYFTSSFLYLLSVLIDNENLSLITKPIIIPSILYFYFIQIKFKTNFLFILSMVLFFIGDMLYLVNIEEYYSLGLVIFLMPYAIFLKFIFKDFIILKKNNEVKKTDITILIIASFLVYLMISILNVLTPSSELELIYYFLFGIELLLIGIMSALLYLYDFNKINFFLLIASSLFIISDVFFIINKNIYGLVLFKVVSVFSQVSSYYFYTLYFLEKNKLKNN